MNNYSISFWKKRGIIHWIIIAAVSLFLSGCFATKVVTVPMRVGGAIVSVVPVVGDTAHDAIDTAADAVDDIPL